MGDGKHISLTWSIAAWISIQPYRRDKAGTDVDKAMREIMSAMMSPCGCQSPAILPQN